MAFWHTETSANHQMNQEEVKKKTKKKINDSQRKQSYGGVRQTRQRQNNTTIKGLQKMQNFGRNAETFRMDRKHREREWENMNNAEKKNIE